MASFQPAASTPRIRSRQNSSFLSRSVLDDTHHSNQSLSGRASIMTYHNKQYTSASAALAAYISDFEDVNPLSETYHRTVEDLLTPRSVLLRAVDRSLETGVRDTRDEWRRYTSKKLLDESFSEMVQGDIEREKMDSLMESSRLLTADLSPLPGSSVITEVESGASLSTDLLLNAPLYPTLKQLPPQIPEESMHEWNPAASSESNHKKGSFRREFEQRFGEFSQENPSLRGQTHNVLTGSHLRSESRPPRSHSSKTPQFKSSISPVKKVALGTVANEFRGDVENLRQAQSALRSGHSLSGQVTGKVTSGRIPTNRLEDPTSSLSMPKQLDHRWNRNSRKENGTTAQTSKTEGGRRPPSWIQDLDVTGVSSLTSQAHLGGGRAPPSWIHDLDKTGLSGQTADTHHGGRAPPSWVQDLDVSGISSNVRCKSFEQGGGGRQPPSWIQDLNSTFTSGKLSDIRSMNNFENTLPASHTFSNKPLSSRKSSSGASLKRTNSANDLPSESHGTVINHPPSLHPKDLHFSEMFLRSTGSGQYSKRNVEFKTEPRPKKASSFTTDDLITASPTGKEFRLPSHNSRGQYLSHNTHSNGARFTDDHLAFNFKKTSSLKKQSSLQSETSQRESLRQSTRGASDLNISSLRIVPTSSLASMPKRSVAFEITPARRSVNGYLDDVRLQSQSSRRGQPSQTLQKKRMHEEDARQREDALLQRAQRVLDDARAAKVKPSNSHRNLSNTDRHDNSLLTDEVLDGDRSWERSLPQLKTLKSIQDADPNHDQDIVAKFLDDCLRSVDENQKLTGGLQPGPVEALKNMLFTLQGMAPNSLSSPAKDVPVPTNEVGEMVSPIQSSPTSASRSGSKDTGTARSHQKYGNRYEGSSESGTDFDDAPGGKSLQRAMEHLSRLKCLVNGGSRLDMQPSSTNAQVMSS